MEYVYASMLLHACEKKINEENVKKVLQAAGVNPDEGRVKALVAALDGVDIDAAIKEAAVAPVAAAPAVSSGSAPAVKAAAPKEEKKDENQAAAGLAGLFG